MSTKKVFVSGCYDMLHSGHVAFFKEAAQYGDLYVGIGSDATVFQLRAKGAQGSLLQVLCLLDYDVMGLFMKTYNMYTL